MPNLVQVEFDPFALGELENFAPSTAPQRELWLGSLLGGDNANRAFNECLILRLEGNISAEALHAALKELVRRHEALRGSFSSDGELFLIARPTVPALTVLDLSELSPSARAQRYEALKHDEVMTAFNLKDGPLFRASLVKLSPTSFRFLFSAHHVVCDGWSAGILMIELAALYRAELSHGDAKRAQLERATSALAHARLQTLREESPEGKHDVEFWLEHLKAPLPVLELPTDRARPEERTYASKRIDIVMGAELTAPLRQLGAKNGCTMLVTFISAMQAWVCLKTGQDDVVLGIPAAGQVASGEQSLIGHWVNLLPIRGKLDRERSFIEHLKSTKRRTLDCFDHQQVTYSALLPKLRIPHDPSRIALVPMCVNIDVGLEKLDFGGPDVEYESIPRCFESFEFFINAVDHRSHLVLECSYNTDLFDEATIRSWMDEFFALVREVCAYPQTSVATFKSVRFAHSGRSRQSEVSAPDLKSELPFAELNNTAVPRLGVPVHEHFCMQAQRTPETEAVRFNGRSLSYGELDRSSTQLAQLLIAQGVGRGGCVGVCLPRSEHLLTVLLGILKAGAAYVPMDPSYPQARLQAIVDDAQVKVLIGAENAGNHLPKVDQLMMLGELLEQLSPEQLSAEAPRSTQSATGRLPKVGGDERAYVLFTSGSTGRPKGVDVPHRAFENVIEAIRREPGFSASERLLAVTTISFDIAGVELFLPLVCGGTVVLASAEQAADPYELKSLIHNERIDYLQATPATWTMLISSGWEGSPKLRVVCTGEAFPPELAKPLLARAGGGVWNLYGPTETTVYSSIKRVLPGQRVTIGRPLDNTQFYILTDAMRPVASGEVGELWIGGEGVSRGYIGRPELTSERFLADPFQPGKRMYKSGDLARLNSDGEVECLGRIDFQVKVRGFRIELGEIEAAIAELAQVQRTVVDVRDLGEGDQRIVAYVMPQAGASLDFQEISSHLSTKLTPYMLPQHLVLVDEMPTTPNGKVDRKALALLSLGGDSPSRSVTSAADEHPATSGSSTSIEAKLMSIWRELLQVESLTPTSSFFDLGGHSMLAVRMLSRIRTSMGVEIPLRVVFKEQTIQKLADYIRVSKGTPSPSANKHPLPAAIMENSTQSPVQLEVTEF